MKYLLPLALIALFVGCSDEQTNSQSHEQTTQADEIVQAKIPEPKSNTTVAIETHAPKKEPSLVQEAKKQLSPMKSIPQPKVHKKEVVDAASLFKSCAGCHGADGKTKALGKSNPIAGMSQKELKNALQGYKEGRRDIHGMGSVMRAQATKLTKEQIEALSEYISKL